MSAIAHPGPPPQTRPVPVLGPRDIARGVLGRFRDVGAVRPDALALTDTREQLTYSAVALEAARVRAAVLRAVSRQAPRAGAPEPVVLLHTHDVHAVTALLGLLGTGHPVMVLDPHTPAPRLAKYVESAGARFCVTDDALLEVAGELVPHTIRMRDVAPVALRTLWDTVPALDAPATLAFTSGSTGKPKGVINDHGSLVRDAWANSVDTGTYGADDVIAHTLPMAFHAGMMATVAGLIVGARMDVYDVRRMGIEKLPARIAEVGATVMQASPAILRAFVGTAPDPQQLATLRSLTLAGEAAYASDLAPVRALLPPEAVVNYRYGSSETGLISNFPIRSGDVLPEGSLPVGRPVGDTVLGLLDEHGYPAAPGEPGTLTVTATQMSRGYWQQPELTATVFTHNPDGTRTYRTSDIGRIDEYGLLHLNGRRDHSVKIRGYLVEPAEVDAVVFALPGVREALTVGRPRGSDGQMRLVCYIVAEPHHPDADQLGVAGIRASLREALPGYMVPETIMFLEALPRTDRGKLDRAALPEPPATRAGAGSADDMTEWERVVAAVWCRVLSLPAVGREDDFFELGGDSLAANTLMEAMITDCGVRAEDATTAALVAAPTLAAFSDRLTRVNDSGDETLVPLLTEGTRTPFFFVAGGGGLGVAAFPLARQLGTDQPMYALQAKAMEKRGRPDWSVRARARRHVRTLRTVQPIGPYRLGGHSFGGLVALEMAHQLLAAGEQVELLVVFDSFVPDPARHPARPAASLGFRAKEAVGVALTGIQGEPGLRQYGRFFTQSYYLGRRYRPAAYPGRTLVLVARDDAEADFRRGWEDYLSGQFRQVEVAGEHLTMLRDPYLAGTAEIVAQELESLDRAGLGYAWGRTGSGIPV